MKYPDVIISPFKVEDLAVSQYCGHPLLRHMTMTQHAMPEACSAKLILLSSPVQNTTEKHHY